MNEHIIFSDLSTVLVIFGLISSVVIISLHINIGLPIYMRLFSKINSLQHKSHSCGQYKKYMLKFFFKVPHFDLIEY